MYILLGFILVAVLWFFVCTYGHGYPNTIEYISYVLKVHARTVRAMHSKAEKELGEKWIKEIEKG